MSKVPSKPSTTKKAARVRAPKRWEAEQLADQARVANREALEALHLARRVLDDVMHEALSGMTEMGARLFARSAVMREDSRRTTLEHFVRASHHVATAEKLIAKSNRESFRAELAVQRVRLASTREKAVA